MDGMYTCEEHDHAVVVYPQRVNGHYTDCPLCKALERIEELEKEAAELHATLEDEGGE